ncbi:rhodanese-like domain-containing protein [Streptomyces misionensis]|uniref:Rhodanese-like domain-containing protein n=1 Tax=Streptomyces misionensis TaxID=67331 RepID=A0A5C6JSZ6_9ACTN|nr:rhodanese-like domain-containing protein [Streptomyces misionensis]TWV44409.1 rhodanese-like domain-containing protein [Streptomyces misionensis]
MSLFPTGEDRATAEEAARRIRAGGAPAVLLAVRQRREWDAGHAPGAVYAPLSGPVAGAALPAAAQARPLVVIRRSGQCTQQTAGLPAARAARVVDVTGGMRAWAAAKHPVVDEHGNSGSIA